jgi:hypothetical protein
MFTHEAPGKIVPAHATFTGIGIYRHAIVSTAVDYAKYRTNQAEGTGYKLARGDCEEVKARFSALSEPGLTGMEESVV